MTDKRLSGKRAEMLLAALSLQNQEQAVTTSGICRVLHMQRQGVARYLKYLENDGLVTLQRSHPRQAVIIHLTPLGSRLAKQLVPSAWPLLDANLQQISKITGLVDLFHLQTGDVFVREGETTRLMRGKRCLLEVIFHAQ